MGGHVADVTAYGTQRGVRTGCILVAVAVVTAAYPASGRAEPTFETTRIPHRDGSGRSTVVEMDPAVPGAREFIRGDERPAPARGEVSLPSVTSIPTLTPAESPRRRR